MLAGGLLKGIRCACGLGRQGQPTIREAPKLLNTLDRLPARPKSSGEKVHRYKLGARVTQSLSPCTDHKKAIYSPRGSAPNSSSFFLSPHGEAQVAALSDPG